jgi:predicted phage terminase large subunit-like protein
VNFQSRKLLADMFTAKAEAERREARYLQTQYGWYDDNGVRQGGLIAFVRYFWSVLEPETPFVDGWPLWAMCEHLEAVTRGEIKRLLVNVPPGFMKSMLTDVFWPAFEWGPMGLAHYRYVAFSYSQLLTMRDNDRFRTLITSPKYQALYGLETSAQLGKREGKSIGMRNTQIVKVMNNSTGWKLASSVGGVTLGERGDRVIIDDPHNMLEAESDIERSKAVRWFRESVSSRLNDLDRGAIVIIMQRLHEDDISGTALGDDFDYVHLMVPWEFDPARAFADDGKVITNEIGWYDPRADEDDIDANNGEPAWLDRFSEAAITRTRNELGPYAWASQYEQSPVPRGKGIFQPEWWGLWNPVNKTFPEFSFTIASLDGAFTDDEQNDPSALTVWGIFDTTTGKRGIMLVAAWAKHLQFSSKRIERAPTETYSMWKQRTSGKWGLIEWVYDSCTWLYGREFKVDRLLIEDKGPGHSAAQEIRNRYGIHEFGVQLVKTKGDKVSRALAIQPIFSNGLVWSPNYDWAELVIRQAAKFPFDRHDDLVDSMTQALRFARDAGLLQSDEERSFADRETMTHRPKQKALYPV